MITSNAGYTTLLTRQLIKMEIFATLLLQWSLGTTVELNHSASLTAFTARSILSFASSSERPVLSWSKTCWNVHKLVQEACTRSQNLFNDNAFGRRLFSTVLRKEGKFCNTVFVQWSLSTAVELRISAFLTACTALFNLSSAVSFLTLLVSSQKTSRNMLKVVGEACT